MFEVMKIKFFLLIIGMGLNVHSVYAKMSDTQQPAPQNSSNNLNTENSNDAVKKITPEFLYSYIDFDFDSTIGLNFNRYHGHSNIYSIGADHIAPIPNLTVGLYVLDIDTEVHSQFQVLQNVLIPSNQTIHNNTLFGHIRKVLTPQLDIDIAGGYGQNRINTQTLLNASTLDMAYSKHNNNNWLTSLNVFYKKQWNTVFLKTYAGILYSQINSGSYVLAFPSIQPGQFVAPLTTKTTYIMEGAEISYKHNSTLTPFINGGLIQVANYTNTRPIFTQQINGSLPQLNMDKNGYKLGGGVAVQYKQLTLRLEEKYYRAGSLFTSYQTIAGLEYRFS